MNKYLDVNVDSKGYKYIRINSNVHKNAAKIFELGECEDGNFWLEESCDNYFSIKLSKDDMIGLFNEVIMFLKGDIK